MIRMKKPRSGRGWCSMCDLKPVAKSKVDVLIDVMDRLNKNLEKVLERDLLHGELHRDAGGLRAGGGSLDGPVATD